MTGRIWLAVAAVLALMVASAWVAWEWQANDYQGQMSEKDRLHQQDLTSIWNAAASQSRQALEKQQAAEQALHDLDTLTTKEKTDALTENDRLRRAVADGDRRLRIAGSCRASDGNLPGTASASSLADAGAVELAPAAGRSVLDIRAGIIAGQTALMALQQYVDQVCLAGLKRGKI